MLAIRSGGNSAVIDRYERELAPLGEGMAYDYSRNQLLWNQSKLHGAASCAARRMAPSCAPRVR